MAEAWIIENRTASYREAAELFGLSHNQIRARIANRYGSLAQARLDPPMARDPRRILGPVRRCICCGVSANIDRGARICDPCTRKNAKLHDGGV